MCLMITFEKKTNRLQFFIISNDQIKSYEMPVSTIDLESVIFICLYVGPNRNDDLVKSQT